MLKEFRDFALRGNVVDLAVGFILGGAFGTIVSSLVNNILMPPIGFLLGGVDFSNLFIIIKEGNIAGHYNSLADAQAAGAISINYGLFLNSVISFVIVAFTMFMLVKVMNKLKRQQEEPVAVKEVKDCPYCFSSIPIKATRCPNCTSEITK
jgi:large conductance mechanosensitive channel